MTKLSSLKTKLSAFTADESGATIIEYALLAALVGVALVATLTTLRGKLSGSFSKVGTQL
jgi:pilus assembly protein Flp/PilA